LPAKCDNFIIHAVIGHWILDVGVSHVVATPLTWILDAGCWILVAGVSHVVRVHRWCDRVQPRCRVLLGSRGAPHGGNATHVDAGVSHVVRVYRWCNRVQPRCRVLLGSRGAPHGGNATHVDAGCWLLVAGCWREPRYGNGSSPRPPPAGTVAAARGGDGTQSTQ
jgi:hypothetical protein